MQHPPSLHGGSSTKEGFWAEAAAAVAVATMKGSVMYSAASLRDLSWAKGQNWVEDAEFAGQG